jgi:uncharacterized protein YllA (UPF0747 family)
MIHPDFSPNVILRGLYQETILPNLAFIGGGGETAYWLQLKDLFNHYKIPFRCCFVILFSCRKSWQERIAKLVFDRGSLLSQEELLNRIVMNESKNEVKLNGSLSELEQLYESFKNKLRQLMSL